MTENELEDSTNMNLNINPDAEDDYLKQVLDVEKQDYLNNEIPLDDVSSIGLKRELNIEGGRSAKKNLIFDLKDVSVFRLYFHLSNNFEIFLMIMGFIGSIASGASNPLMAYLTGSTTSDASESAEDRLNTMNERQ